jgi:hypothetical protein
MQRFERGISMKTIHSTIPDPTLPYRFFQPIEEVVFFDIETTGLSPRASSLYLIGAMHFDSVHHEWHMIQWFAQDYHSEAAMIRAFFDFLTPFHVLYHFNGAAFDIPYLLAKCEKHGITPSSHTQHLLENLSHHRDSSLQTAFSIDILKEIRPFKKILSLKHANQTFLEQWLGICREDCYDGGQLIPLYTKYMQSRLLHSEDAQALEEILLLHNHDDMAGMLEICSIFAFTDALTPDAPPRITHREITQNFLTLEFALKQAVPKQILLTHPFSRSCDTSELPPATLSLCREHGVLTLPLYRGTLKYFFPSYREYYYFPEEDTSIHKSVAQFMDPSTRQKATAATCYTKKEGSFFPSLSAKPAGTDTPLFYEEYRQKPAYYLLPPSDDTSFWGEYLVRELPSW